MPINIQAKRVSDHLNLVRGLAALAVLVYHVRYRFFFDYRDLRDPDLFASAFYGLTAFGHDAVMVFFVLSGYFIGGSIRRDRQAQRWSWGRYLANRATRLYLVLLPGLLLTICWDRLGLFFYPRHPIYSGEARPWIHDFFCVGDRLSAGTFAGNLLFLQTILVPPFGSNEPLWSLSYEFWYYLLFPCLWLALARPASRPKAVAYLVLAALLVLGLGKMIALYFPIWLFGVGLCVAPQVPWLKRPYPFLVPLIALGLFGCFVAATHTSAFRGLFRHSLVAVDYATGLGFALVLYLLLHDQSPAGDGGYGRTASLLADFSFTLYVTHMPVLVFLRAALAPDTPWTPDLAHVGLAGLLAGSCALYAFALSRLTEAQTDSVRHWVLRCLARCRPKAAQDLCTRREPLGLRTRPAAVADGAGATEIGQES